MTRVTIVGAGLAGLTAAIACAEAGADVVVHEAHAVPGGRARTTAPPWIAHEGPHAFYADGPHWRWLVERDLVGPAATLSLADARGVRFHRDGRLRRTPPAGLLAMVAHRRRRAPVDRDFFSWAAELHGAATARTAANAARRRHLRRRPRPALGRLRLGPAAARHRAARPDACVTSSAAGPP